MCIIVFALAKIDIGLLFIFSREREYSSQKKIKRFTGLRPPYLAV